MNDDLRYMKFIYFHCGQKMKLRDPRRSYFQLLVSVVFLAARISYIRFFTAVQIYEFHISKSLFGIDGIDWYVIIRTFGKEIDHN